MVTPKERFSQSELRQSFQILLILLICFILAGDSPQSTTSVKDFPPDKVSGVFLPELPETTLSDIESDEVKSFVNNLLTIRGVLQERPLRVNDRVEMSFSFEVFSGDKKNSPQKLKMEVAKKTIVARPTKEGEISQSEAIRLINQYLNTLLTYPGVKKEVPHSTQRFSYAFNFLQPFQGNSWSAELSISDSYSTMPEDILCKDIVNKTQITQPYQSDSSNGLGEGAINDQLQRCLTNPDILIFGTFGKISAKNTATGKELVGILDYQTRGISDGVKFNTSLSSEEVQFVTQVVVPFLPRWAGNDVISAFGSEKK